MISVVERVVGREAKIDAQPEQPGDVRLTFASIEKARALLDYAPTTRIEDGVAKQWAALQATVRA